MWGLLAGGCLSLGHCESPHDFKCPGTYINGWDDVPACQVACSRAHAYIQGVCGQQGCVLSAGRDFEYEATTGERAKQGLGEKLMGSYLEAVMKMSITDTTVYIAVQQVSGSILQFTPSKVLGAGHCDVHPVAM